MTDPTPSLAERISCIAFAFELGDSRRQAALDLSFEVLALATRESRMREACREVLMVAIPGAPGGASLVSATAMESIRTALDREARHAE